MRDGAGGDAPPHTLLGALNDALDDVSRYLARQIAGVFGRIALEGNSVRLGSAQAAFDLSHGAERIVGLARNDGIYRRDNRPGRPQRGAAGRRRQDRIGVDAAMTARGHGSEQPLDKGPRVDPDEILGCRLRCLAPLQPHELRRIERLQHGPQSGRRLRMIRPGIMLEAGRMGVQQRRHLCARQQLRPSVA